MAGEGANSKQDRPGRGGRADYRLFRALPTRWSDNDVYGHVNNVVAYALFDTAVNAALIEGGALDPEGGPAIALVVESACRYHAPMTFPDTVHAGLRVARIGGSSVVYELGLFAGEAPLAAVEGRFVHVYVDRGTRRPVPIPQPARALLHAWRA